MFFMIFIMAMVLSFVCGLFWLLNKLWNKIMLKIYKGGWKESFIDYKDLQDKELMDLHKYLGSIEEPTKNEKDLYYKVFNELYRRGIKGYEKNMPEHTK